MVKTLVMQHKDRKYEMTKFVSEHQDWQFVETDDYLDAMEQIQSGAVDVLAVGAEVPCGDCIDLVSSLREEKPDANVYVILSDEQKCDRSKSFDRGFIYSPQSVALD